MFLSSIFHQFSWNWPIKNIPPGNEISLPKRNTNYNLVPILSAKSPVCFYLFTAMWAMSDRNMIQRMLFNLPVLLCLCPIENSRSHIDSILLFQSGCILRMNKICYINHNLFVLYYYNSRAFAGSISNSYRNFFQSNFLPQWGQ